MARAQAISSVITTKKIFYWKVSFSFLARSSSSWKSASAGWSVTKYDRNKMSKQICAGIIYHIRGFSILLSIVAVSLLKLDPFVVPIVYASNV